LKAKIDISREQISQGKQFILSWKVREDKFRRVVGAMDLGQLSIFTANISGTHRDIDNQSAALSTGSLRS